MAEKHTSRGYKRRQWIVDPPLQYRFVLIMLLVLCAQLLGAVGAVYFAIWITLNIFELVGNALAIAQMTTVGLIITLELLILAPIVVSVGLRLTHKVAGPLVRINAALQRMSRGDYDVHLKIRKGDSLSDAAGAINTLALALRSKKH